MTWALEPYGLGPEKEKLGWKGEETKMNVHVRWFQSVPWEKRSGKWKKKLGKGEGGSGRKKRAWREKLRQLEVLLRKQGEIIAQGSEIEDSFLDSPSGTHSRERDVHIAIIFMTRDGTSDLH